MNEYTPNHYIEIISEKRVNTASKGRNQWVLLKKFDRKCVVDFIEAAKGATRHAPPGTYQEGNWWDRELDHCRRKLAVIRIVLRSAAAVASTMAERYSQAELTPPAIEILPLRLKPSTISLASAGVGIYLVTLNDEEPISTNAHDARIADTCVRVNRDNCKFGKAQRLSGRRENYRRTFGEHNANFVAIASVAPQDLDRAERLVSDKLRFYRISGPSGRITEWMKNIEPMQVIRIALSTLQEHGINYTKLC